MAAEAGAPRQGHRRAPRQARWDLLLPLAYAPALPLLRLALRKRPRHQRDLAFGGGVLVALAHAGYIMAGDSTMWGGDGKLER